MLLAALDLVLALDVDKILAGDALIFERLYIVGDVHRSKHVVGLLTNLAKLSQGLVARQ